MNKETIIEQSIALIEKTLGTPREKIVPEAKLVDLTADSIQLFELVLAFENEFGLQAAYDDLIAIVTVQDTFEYLERQLLPVPQAQ